LLKAPAGQLRVYIAALGAGRGLPFMRAARGRLLEPGRRAAV